MKTKKSTKSWKTHSPVAKKRKALKEKAEKITYGNAKRNYNNIVSVAFGKNKPPFEIWQGYIEAMEDTISFNYRKTGALPSSAGLTAIDKRSESLLKVLMKKEAQGHYKGVIDHLITAHFITKSLRERRSKTKRTSKILTAKNKALCKAINNIWKGYKNKNITGTYNWRLDHALDRDFLDEFDPAKNPGAFLVQATLREYFGIKLDCKQTKDLIMGMDK